MKENKQLNNSLDLIFKGDGYDDNEGLIQKLKDFEIKDVKERCNSFEDIEQQFGLANNSYENIIEAEYYDQWKEQNILALNDFKKIFFWIHHFTLKRTIRFYLDR